MALPAYGGVTGWASLAWRGGRWFGGLGPNGTERPVWLATAGTHIRPRPGIAVSAERLAPGDLEVVDGLPLTSAVRSTWFEMRHAVADRDAAVALSMAAYDDHVSIEEMVEFAWLHPGWTGTPQCRSGTALAYENCWSPMEVLTAIVWEVDAELPRLRCNEPMFDRRGRHLATPDLLDVEAGLAIEYEGPDHLSRQRRSSDVRREELLRGHGLEYLTVMGSHLGNRWELVSRMQSARRASRFEPTLSRSWTTDLPSWWVPTHTVALRRALTDDQRDRLLGYRRAA